jgi:hypothetical protein
VAEEQKQTGLKYDTGKPPLELVDPEFIEGVGRVLGFGAKKYSAHNWRGGFAFSRAIGAALRHTGAFNRGEDNDPESGECHLFHAACCLMFLSWFHKHRPDLDDRFKY